MSVATQTPINAVLDSTIDSKKAKQGDTVTAHAAEAVKSADSSNVIPKGAKLIGHVTHASSRAKGDSDSMLGIQFDKAQLKDKQEVALGKMEVEAVAAPAQSASSFGGSSGGSTAAPGAPSNNPSMSGSRGARPESGNPSSTNPSSTNPGAPTSTEETGATGPLPPNARGVYGLEDLSLARNSTNGETVITSKGKNVRLDSGTRLLLVPEQQGAAAPGR